jgi:hypothetical protein
LLQRAWRAANPDYMREYGRAWRQLNAEKERARKRRRKQAKRVGIRDRLFKLQRGRCAVQSGKACEGAGGFCAREGDAGLVRCVRV